jgi:hypothetical protein
LAKEERHPKIWEKYSSFGLAREKGLEKMICGQEAGLERDNRSEEVVFPVGGKEDGISRRRCRVVFRCHDVSGK